VTWREVVDVKWLRRFGGAAGDLVLTLQDGAKVEMRALAEFERNLNFIMAQLGDGVAADSGNTGSRRETRGHTYSCTPTSARRGHAIPPHMAVSRRIPRIRSPVSPRGALSTLL